MDWNPDPSGCTFSTTKRRQFLTVVAAVTATAGCLGDDDDLADDRADGDDADDAVSADDGEDDSPPEEEAAIFTITDVELAATTVRWHDEIEAEATIENTGDLPGDAAVTFSVDGTEFATGTVVLDVGEIDTVAFEPVNTAALTPGEHEYVVAVDEDEVTGTVTITAFGEDPDSLFSLDDATDGMLPLSPGRQVVTGSLWNGHPFSLEEGEIKLTGPDEITINEQSGTTFESLAAHDSHTVEWEIDIPDDAGGAEYAIIAYVTYSAGGEGTEEEHELTAKVAGSPTISVDEIDVDDLGPEWVHAYAPETDGTPSDEPTVSFPESDDQIYIREDEWDGPDGPADVYFGYDSAQFYLHVEVTDEEHNTLEGTSMWEGDSLQFATGSGPTLEWGGEYGARHDEDTGEPEMVQYDAGPVDGDESDINIDTSREDNTTSYHLAIPWEALLTETPEPGETVPFDLTVHEREDDTPWLGAYSWSDFAVFSPKHPEHLGRVTLEDDGDERPYEVSLYPDGPDGISAGEEGEWTITVMNWATTAQEIFLEIRDTSVADSIVLDAESAAAVTIEWMLVDDETVTVDFDNDVETYTSAISVSVS